MFRHPGLSGAWVVPAKHHLGQPVGIALAAVSAVSWLFAMPAFPLFALAAMVVAVLISYGLSVHWEH